ncbi:DUF397 domain-containing protein [Streptomyces sp. NPDC051909]|uniref:DUF397 domain-containing protein n=1 Tax=Streptomyces sp. NPDC051909 TaxID=3154944 RepID=UPI0034138015
MSSELTWFKSSYSGSEGECVEVALTTATIHVRDSKNPTFRSLTLSPASWVRFARSLEDLHA